MPERTLVHESARSAADHRGLAEGLQRSPAPRGTGQPDSERIRRRRGVSPPSRPGVSYQTPKPRISTFDRYIIWGQVTANGLCSPKCMLPEVEGTPTIGLR